MSAYFLKSWGGSKALAAGLSSFTFENSRVTVEPAWVVSITTGKPFNAVAFQVVASWVLP